MFVDISNERNWRKSETSFATFVTMKKVFSRMCVTRSLFRLPCSAAIHHKPWNGGIFFSLWSTTVRLPYRAMPISKKIVQQKLTPFRLTKRGKKKNDDQHIWQICSCLFLFYLFSRINEAIAHLATPPPPLSHSERIIQLRWNWTTRGWGEERRE